MPTDIKGRDLKKGMLVVSTVGTYSELFVCEVDKVHKVMVDLYVVDPRVKSRHQGGGSEFSWAGYHTKPDPNNPPKHRWQEGRSFRRRGNCVFIIEEDRAAYATEFAQRLECEREKSWRAGYDTGHEAGLALARASHD